MLEKKGCFKGKMKLQPSGYFNLLFWRFTIPFHYFLSALLSVLTIGVRLINNNSALAIYLIVQ